MSELSPEIVELEPQETIAVRGEVAVAELPGFFERAFHEAAEAASATGVEIVGAPFGYYPQMPTDRVVVEAGFPVSAPAASHGAARRLVLPGGLAVRATHVGPFERLEETYAELEAWMQQQGLHAASEMWERYLSDPETEPDPANWRTGIVWPVERSSTSTGG